MVTLSRATVLRRAIKRCGAKTKQLIDEIQRILDSRGEKCSADCPGWVPGDVGPERCDDCARLNGYAAILDDAAVAMLPAARAAQSRCDNDETVVTRPDATQRNPDAAGFYSWTVQLEIHEVWVQDGADFTDARVHDMLIHTFPYATGDEVKGKVLTRPPDEAVATCMGHRNVAEYLHVRGK